MTLISTSTFLLIGTLAVVALVEGGVVSNESQSVSVSSSSSITKSKSTDEVKKSSARSGKVIYTAPYSNVRVSSKSEQMKPSSLVPPKFRSLSNGPVLIRKGEEKPTTTTTPTTTPTTTTTTTTPVPVILVDLVTDDPITTSSEEVVESDPTTVTPKAA